MKYLARIFLGVICGLVATSGCSGLTADPTSPVDRGATLLAPFKNELKAALVQGMQGGTISAISVCSEAAPAIAEKNSKSGVRMGRSSHRLRNANNVAPDWVAPAIKAYVTDPSNRQPTSIDLGEQRRGYVEPIEMQPLCVGCHGQTLAAEVAEAIESRYPEDEATGFSVGELRGVFWVEYPDIDQGRSTSDTGD